MARKEPHPQEPGNEAKAVVAFDWEDPVQIFRSCMECTELYRLYIAAFDFRGLSADMMCMPLHCRPVCKAPLA